ncbi:DUF177 domain-containing protein [Ravibacter arvi]|uniref:DUF177 domain-containing protein n=1 Tax=Ravibacter arvi TaxID=2051041 RepID=A0ABP8M249_9BACT
MEELKKYNIDIVGLAEREHVFHYTSGDGFFQEFEQDLIEKGRFEADLVLQKSSTMIRLDFKISGVVGQVCDRTLEPYDEHFETENRIFLKFGDRDEELTDEIEMIQRNTARINVARYVYDFIALALPVKKLHPRLRSDENGEEEEVLVYGTSADSPKGETASSEEDIDPRWAALKGIKQEK